MSNSNIRDTRFWKSDEPYKVLFENVKSIRNRCGIQSEKDFMHACLYGDTELTGFGGQAVDNLEYEPSRLAFNVVRQTVDTLAAKIAKNQPLPLPVTTGGDFMQQRRAKKFGKMIQGQFDNCGVWRTSPTVARDCALFGTGITHNYRVEKTIHHERVFPWEISIDPRDGQYGRPRTMYMRRWVDRYVLAERFPELEYEIMQVDSGSNVDEFELGYDTESDLVLVIEAWHLPSKELKDSDKDVVKGEPGHDGKHVICVNNATLYEEPWRKQCFPFTVLRMSDPVKGWYGTGLAEQLTGLQYTINDTASVVQEAHALSGGYILVEKGSNVNPEHLVNGRGVKLEYTGTAPSWINPQPVHPDTMQFVLQLIPKAFEMTGVSQLSAQSQKPAGIESAIALNTFNDIETERFALFAKQYEQYHIDVAWQFFELTEEIFEEYGDANIKVSTRDRGMRVLKSLDYGKIRMDRDDFALEVYASSMLSKKPAAKMEEVQQFANAGWITPDQAKELLDFPDLERFNNLSQAGSRVIDEVIDRMLEAEDPESPDAYIYPEPEFNLKMCISKALAAYQNAKIDNAPQGNLDLLLQFIQDAEYELNSAVKPGTEPPMGQPGAMPIDPNSPPMDPSMMPPPGGALPPEMMPPPGAPPMAAPMPPQPV